MSKSVIATEDAIPIDFISPKIEIDVEAYPSGIYFLGIDEVSIYSKFLKLYRPRIM